MVPAEAQQVAGVGHGHHAGQPLHRRRHQLLSHQEGKPGRGVLRRMAGCGGGRYGCRTEGQLQFRPVSALGPCPCLGSGPVRTVHAAMPGKLPCLCAAAQRRQAAGGAGETGRHLPPCLRQVVEPYLRLQLRLVHPRGAQCYGAGVGGDDSQDDAKHGGQGACGARFAGEGVIVGWRLRVMLGGAVPGQRQQDCVEAGCTRPCTAGGGHPGQRCCRPGGLPASISTLSACD